MTYRVCYNDDDFNLKSNEIITIDNDSTENEEVYLTIKHMWLKSKTIKLSTNINYRIEIYGFLSNNQVYLMLSCLLLCFIMSFTSLTNYDAYYEITSGIYLSFIFIMLYKITFGKNEYINIQFK